MTYVYHYKVILYKKNENCKLRSIKTKFNINKDYKKTRPHCCNLVSMIFLLLKSPYLQGFLVGVYQ